MNKIILIGNLTRDTELTTTQNGTNIETFSIAVNSSKETDFFTIKAYDKLGENAHKYLKKGNKCAVVGAIHNKNYKAKDGTTKYYTEIVADTIEFLTPKEDQVARDIVNKQVRYEIQ